MLQGNYRSSSLKIPKSINNGTCQLAWYCFRRKRHKLEIYVQKEFKNPIYIQKEAKTPQYCISNISKPPSSAELEIPHP
jgi:hypothetical protein